MPNNLYEALWIFILYACIGWLVEVSYAALSKGVFENRGFLNGPYCPIYGFGILIVTTLLSPLQVFGLCRTYICLRVSDWLSIRKNLQAALVGLLGRSIQYYGSYLFKVLSTLGFRMYVRIKTNSPSHCNSHSVVSWICRQCPTCHFFTLALCGLCCNH